MAVTDREFDQLTQRVGRQDERIAQVEAAQDENESLHHEVALLRKSVDRLSNQFLASTGALLLIAAGVLVLGPPGA